MKLTNSRASKLLNHIAEMTDEEIDARRVDVQVELAEIKAQLEEARAAVATTGKYADPGWYRDAGFALRLKGIEYNLLLAEAAKRRRVSRQNEHAFGRGQNVCDGNAERFVLAARRLLTADTFDMIAREAQAPCGVAPGKVGAR